MSRSDAIEALEYDYPGISPSEAVKAWRRIQEARVRETKREREGLIKALLAQYDWKISREEAKAKADVILGETA